MSLVWNIQASGGGWHQISCSVCTGNLIIQLVCRPLLLALTNIIFVSFELNKILYYCQLTSRPHAIISQKTIIFTGTTMKTLDLTKLPSHEPSVCGVLPYFLMRGQRAEIYEVCNWRWLVDIASPGLQAASSLQ